MRLYLDTEFTGLQLNGTLISLALVSEDKSYFYAEFTDYDQSQITDWHRKHVLANLILDEVVPSSLPPKGTSCKGNTSEITSSLTNWLQQWETVNIWADVAAYDWVFFCDLFGGALHLPESIHYIVRDLATLLEIKGYDPDLDRFQLAFGDSGPPGNLPRHNALADAWACRNCVQQLIKTQ